MNKEIDWHGPTSASAIVALQLNAAEKARVYFSACERGAWPREAEIPVGWDERDALV